MALATDNLFNEGELTSSSIDRQFTPEFVTKAVVEVPKRKKFFSIRSNKINMPKNHGDKVTKEVRLPMLHKDNMVDGGVDTSTADIIENVWYVVNSTGTVLNTFDAKNYLRSAGGVYGDKETAGTAVYKAYTAAVAAKGSDTLKSGAGEILGGNASYATSTGPLVPLPEEGGVVNLMNSSSKLISANVSFHGAATRYTVRSINLDSRKNQVATKVMDLGDAVADLKEMQVQNSLLAAGAANTMISTTNATTTVISEVDSMDVLTYDALNAFELELQRDDVPMDTEILSGVDLVDTKTVEDAYIAYINRELVPTLRNMKGPGDALVWVPKSQYAAGTTLLDGEVGSIGSFRFVVVPDLQREFAGGDIVGGALITIQGNGTFVIGTSYKITVAANGTDFTSIGAEDNEVGTVFVATGTTATDGDIGDAAVDDAETGNAAAQSGAYSTLDANGSKYYDIFTMLVVGDDSFSIAGFGYDSTKARHINPKADVHNDMYAEVGGVSAKWSYGFLNYRPERIKSLKFSVQRTGKAPTAA